MKIIRWLAMNGVMGATAYYGLIEGVEGALNIALMMAVFHIFVSIMISTDKGRESLSKERRTVPASINVCFELSIVALFAWHGYILLSALLLVAMILIESAWVESRKLAGTEK